MKQITSITLSFFCIFSCQVALAGKYTVPHPLYAGFAVGAGSTTWDGLVPDEKKQNLALNLSTPIEVKEGGAVYGFFMGYEFFKYFALEASYMRYPHAKITFDPISLFSFDHEGVETFSSHTDTVNLMGKIMVPIPTTDIRLYTSAGAARIRRRDILVDEWLFTPTFGLGVNYDFTPHILGEIGANYTAGFGESQMNPSETYFPFLYSVFLRLGYRF